MKSILIAILILVPLLSFAQTGRYTTTTVSITEVNINAIKLASPVSKTGRSVEILFANDIESLPVTTIDELLRYVAGMNLNQRGSFGVQNDIGMRGSTFSQVLILVDEVRFNDPLTAHFNSNFPVPLSSIGRIEIIRGPAAAAYGPDAVGGVIHLKTKTYLTSSDQDFIDINGNTSFGQRNLQTIDAGGLYHKKKWTFSVGYKSNSSDGERLINPNYTAGVASDGFYNSFFDLKTFTSAIKFRPNKNLSIYARGGYDTRDFNAKYFYTRSTFDESVEYTDNLWGQAIISHKKGKHDIDVIASFKQVDDQFVFNPGFSPNDHQTDQITLQANHRIDVNDENAFAYGFQGIQNTIESTDRGNHDNMSVGGYASLQNSSFGRLTSNISLRLEYNENFGFEILPQLGLSYPVKDFVFRTSYGRSVRAADYTERYVSSLIPNLTPGRNIGNPDLEAERSHSVDLGTDWIVNSRTKISLTGFHRISKNLIDFSLTNQSDIANQTNLQANEDYFYASNVSESNVSGIELAIQNDIPFGKSKKNSVQADLAYTFLNTNVNSGMLSKYISNHPDHNIGVVLGLKFHNVQINSATNFVVRDTESEPLIDGLVPNRYVVSNLKVAYSPVPEFSIFSTIFNVTNEKYQDILGAPLASRWISLGITWDFTKILERE